MATNCQRILFMGVSQGQDLSILIKSGLTLLKATRRTCLFSFSCMHIGRDVHMPLCTYHRLVKGRSECSTAATETIDVWIFKNEQLLIWFNCLLVHNMHTKFHWRQEKEGKLGSFETLAAQYVYTLNIRLSQPWANMHRSKVIIMIIINGANIFGPYVWREVTFTF